MARKLLKFIQQQNQPYQKNSSKRSRKDGLHQGLSGNVGRSCDDELHPEFWPASVGRPPPRRGCSQRQSTQAQLWTLERLRLGNNMNKLKLWKRGRFFELNYG